MMEREEKDKVTVGEIRMKFEKTLEDQIVEVSALILKGGETDVLKYLNNEIAPTWKRLRTIDLFARLTLSHLQDEEDSDPVQDAINTTLPRNAKPIENT